MTHKRGYLRFPLKYRLEHWVLFLTFTALAVTGLVQKYAQADLSIRLIELLGGIASIRSIHRIAATMMMIETIYHFGQIVYNLRVRRHNPELMLTRTDFRNAWQALKYNLGRSSEHPRQGRYTFEEKFEYFALIWGTIVMIVTGFVLWNPIAATAVLPGEFIPTAKAIHSGEALLAVLSLIVWHFYHVHIRSFNRSMFTGYLPMETMQEEHPLELEEAQQTAGGVPDAGYHNRRRVYLISYGALSLLLLVGIYLFITFEETAITTVPPQEKVEIFTPNEAQLPEPVSF
ncbi:MAG: cytochrome b/b6 domain-containing protein, partial [Anaerolineae bacterium]|nr:cytochrome b/b6 domain-containing protein [Anaerolineae bacterium]